MSIPQVPAQGCYYEAHNNVVDSFKDTFSCMSKLQIKDRTDEADTFLSKIGKIFALIVLFIPVGICYGVHYLYKKVTDCCNKSTVTLPNETTPPAASTAPTAQKVEGVATEELGTNISAPRAPSPAPRATTPVQVAPKDVTVEDASPSPAPTTGAQAGEPATTEAPTQAVETAPAPVVEKKDQESPAPLPLNTQPKLRPVKTATDDTVQIRIGGKKVTIEPQTPAVSDPLSPVVESATFHEASEA